MTQELAIALAQMNSKVGDVAGNVVKVRQARSEARKLGADLVVYSELNICGYPPEDLVLKPAFQAACRAAVENLARETADGGPALLVGAPWVEEGRLYNAALLLADGEILARRFKRDLPNYGVFDEKRLFAAGVPPGADQLSRCAPWRDGLRGHVDLGGDGDAGGVWGGAVARSQWQPL